MNYALAEQAARLLQQASSDELRYIVAVLCNDSATTGHKLPTMLSMTNIYNTARCNQPEDIRNFLNK